MWCFGLIIVLNDSKKKITRTPHFKECNHKNYFRLNLLKIITIGSNHRLQTNLKFSAIRKSRFFINNIHL